MRRWLPLLLVACGSTRESFEGADAGPADASAPVDAGVEAAPPVEAGVDAGRDVDASDAFAPPGLFDACAPELCSPNISEPNVGSASLSCWGDHTPSAHVDMFERCTFSCHNPNAPQGLDPEKRALCEARGGECFPWQVGGIPICMPKP